MSRLKPLILMLSVWLIAGCSSDDVILSGERIAVVPNPETELTIDAEAASEGAGLPTTTRNTMFMAPGQNPGHRGGHFFIELPLKKAFSVRVGVGVDLGTDMAQPVANEEAVFTITPGGVLTASDVQTGDVIWSLDIDPSTDKTQLASSGGLALATTPRGDELYAHANKDVLVAFDAKDGTEKWRAEFDVFLSGGPTVGNGVIVVKDFDGRLYALSDLDGQELWNRIGTPDETGLVGSAWPAIFASEVVSAGSDGAILSLSLDRGDVLWSEDLTPIQLQTALESIADIRAHPIHDGGLIFAISHSGVLYAFNAQGGWVIWEKPLHGIEMPWLAGQSLFVTTIDGRVFALRRSDGATRWMTELPDAYDPSLAVVDGATHYTSAVVASGKVVVASSEGELHVLNAESGAEESTLNAGGSVTTAPIVANGTIFVLNRSGRLVAFR